MVGLQPPLRAARRAAADGARPARRPRALDARQRRPAPPTTTGSTIPRTAAAGCSARAATSSTCSATWPARPRSSAPRGRACRSPERPIECSDSFAAHIRFASGAVGTLVYSGGGDPKLPKERLEAFGGGVSAVLDDFRRLELYRGGKRTVGSRAGQGPPRRDRALPGGRRRRGGGAAGRLLPRLDAAHAGARRLAPHGLAGRGRGRGSLSCCLPRRNVRRELSPAALPPNHG